MLNKILFIFVVLLFCNLLVLGQYNTPRGTYPASAYRSTASVKESKKTFFTMPGETETIAFRTKSIVSIRSVTFNEFKYDNRTAVLVAFKIIRIDKNGAITIIWRLLQNKKSPKLEIG